MGLLFDPLHRREYIRTGLATIRDIVAIGIILDVVAQFLIFGQVHPGAALLIGPVLITAPYAIARALTNRAARIRSPGPKSGILPRSPDTSVGYPDRQD